MRRILALTLALLMVSCEKRAIAPHIVLPAGCGGATYPCSIHQTPDVLTVIAEPSTPPPMGNLRGRGNTFTDPTYGGNITLRCTDVDTDPPSVQHSGSPAVSSYEVTDTGGDNVIQWNADQTLLRVVRANTGSTGIVGFTLDGGCTTMNPASYIPAGAQWSLKNPAWDYYKQQGAQTIVHRRTFDPSQPLAPPTDVTLFDFYSCPLMAGIPVKWSTQMLTADDDVFWMAFSTSGGQDTGTYVIGLQVSTKGCYLLNTMTGVSQNSGCLGQAGSMGPQWFPFTIHSMYQSPGNILIVGVGNTCTGCPPHGPFVWHPATTHMELITTNYGGHNTTGIDTYVNLTNSPRIGYRLFTALTDTTITPAVNFAFPAAADTHMTWLNDDGTDTMPICATEASKANSGTAPIPISVPLQQETWCVDPWHGTYIRVGHTFSTGIATSNWSNFRTQNAILANGSKGYIAVASDWKGKLGNIDGKTFDCIPNKDCRADVFIQIPK